MGIRKGRPAGRRRFLLVFLIVPACSMLLAGCTSGLRDAVSQAVDESSASVATAGLAADLDASGKLTRAATSTALEDALKELGQTRTTVVELSATGQTERELRDEALAAMDECVYAVSAAADAVSSKDGRPSAAQGSRLLESAAARLSELKTRLGAK